MQSKKYGIESLKVLTLEILRGKPYNFQIALECIGEKYSYTVHNYKHLALNQEYSQINSRPILALFLKLIKKSKNTFW